MIELTSILISIHALRKESDLEIPEIWEDLKKFQSTLSVRRATISVKHDSLRPKFQSTLSVRRATRMAAPRPIAGV